MLHQDLTNQEAQAKAIDLLDRCGIPDPRQRLAETMFRELLTILRDSDRGS